MPSLKATKTKIKSTGNLKKISRALEIISTIKLQKNKAKVESAKQYFLDLSKLIAEVSEKIDLFDNIENTNDKQLAILITSEKGLCWWLNSKLLKLFSSHHDPKYTEVFVLGKKWYEFCKRLGYTIVGYLNLKDEIKQLDIIPLLQFLEEKSKSYSHIELFFNFFQSILSQTPSQFSLFPLSKENISLFLAQVGIDYRPKEWNKKTFEVLEPNKEAVKSELQRQITNYLITATVLQNKIAEHAGRMLAMKNAKDNCTKFMSTLTLQYNKMRQANITKEISEITWAKIAMES